MLCLTVSFHLRTVILCTVHVDVCSYTPRPKQVPSHEYASWCLNISHCKTTGYMSAWFWWWCITPFTLTFSYYWKTWLTTSWIHPQVKRIKKVTQETHCTENRSSSRESEESNEHGLMDTHRQNQTTVWKLYASWRVLSSVEGFTKHIPSNIVREATTDLSSCLCIGDVLWVSSSRSKGNTGPSKHAKSMLLSTHRH